MWLGCNLQTIFFRMIKVKVFVQLKSGVYGRCVMIYKSDQVSTTFPHKMNHLLMHWSSYPYYWMWFWPEKNPTEILVIELVLYQQHQWFWSYNFFVQDSVWALDDKPVDINLFKVNFRNTSARYEYVRVNNKDTWTTSIRSFYSRYC